MNTFQVDGSGLSRHDLISPATMKKILQYIAQNGQQLHIISMLPLSGYDATLRYRAGLHEAGVDGKIWAKTGSLQGRLQSGRFYHHRQWTTCGVRSVPDWRCSSASE